MICGGEDPAVEALLVPSRKTLHVSCELLALTMHFFFSNDPVKSLIAGQLILDEIRTNLKNPNSEQSHTPEISDRNRTFVQNTCHLVRFKDAPSLFLHVYQRDW